jgi:hypothetical protein
VICWSAPEFGGKQWLRTARLGRRVLLVLAPRHGPALRRPCGLPGLASYGVTDAARIAAMPSGSLKTNPIALTTSELERIITVALD